MTKCFFYIFFLTGTVLFGQGTVFCPKGGLSLGIQNWNGYERAPLIAAHGAIAFETYSERGNALFGQLGYHARGSSEDVFFFTGGGTGFRERQSFKFNNVAAVLGARRELNVSGANKPYFAFGVRIEYTVSTNLDQYLDYAGYFPIDAFVNKFNYGGTAMFGYEFPFSDLFGGFIEASLHPDFSKQYEQPGGPGIISPITGQSFILREQSVRNITFELSVGLRLVHKVVYLD